MSSASMEIKRCQACGVRVSKISLVVSLLLAVIKTVIGVEAKSRALVACALYSVNDALSSAVALITLRVARRPPDVGHAYGHGKAEFIAIGFMSIILGLAVIFFLIYSLADVITGVEVPPHVLALLAALVTAAVNYFLCKWESCAARHMASPVLHTSAEHNHADALSSAMTVIGIAGAMLGLRFLDPLVAVLETLDVMRLSGSLLGNTLKGLMDTALPTSEVVEITRVATAVPGVLKVSGMRTRQSGPLAWIDLEIAVEEHLSVEQAHAIADELRTAIREHLKRPAEVQVRFRPRREIEPFAAAVETHA